MRTWNYLYYHTWKLQNIIGEILIQRPIYFIMLNLFPFLQKNKKRGLKDYKKVMNNKEDGFNLFFAFGFMYLTTTLIIALLCGFTIGQFDSNVDDNLHLYFIGVLSVAYLVNYISLWKSDVYKKYFKEFENIITGKIHYLFVVLFHFGIAILFILTVYWTVGFNL